MSNYVKKEIVSGEIPNFDLIKEDITIEDVPDFCAEKHEVQDDVRPEEFEAEAFLDKRNNGTCRQTRHTLSTNCSCEVCGKNIKGYVGNSNYKRHLRSHSNEKNVHCSKCVQSFKTKSDLAKHRKNTHAMDNPLQCHVCLKRFTKCYFLKKHSRHHTKERPHKCDQCDKAFWTEFRLKLHKAAVHATVKVCWKWSATSGRLIEHSKYHTERPHECDKCDKVFKAKFYRDMHKTHVHATERPFPCEVCSKVFRTTWSLKGHSKIHSKTNAHATAVEKQNVNGVDVVDEVKVEPTEIYDPETKCRFIKEELDLDIKEEPPEW